MPVSRISADLPAVLLAAVSGMVWLPWQSADARSVVAATRSVAGRSGAVAAWLIAIAAGRLADDWSRNRAKTVAVICYRWLLAVECACVAVSVDTMI